MILIGWVIAGTGEQEQTPVSQNFMLLYNLAVQRHANMPLMYISRHYAMNKLPLRLAYIHMPFRMWIPLLRVSHS
jgi:hypothetical protein